jgi:hypothetical protein
MGMSNFNILGREERGYMKRKNAWGKVKHSCYILVKASFKFVSSINKIGISFCPALHIGPFCLMHFYSWTQILEIKMPFLVGIKLKNLTQNVCSTSNSNTGKQKIAGSNPYSIHHNRARILEKRAKIYSIKEKVDIQLYPGPYYFPRV